jgi:hypothetical protein
MSNVAVVDDGAFYVGGDAEIAHSNVVSNAAGGDVGGFNVVGNAALMNSRVSANRAGGNGGGFVVTGTVTIKDTAITSNTAGASGGGFVATGDTQITNGEIAKNVAAFSGGGFVVTGTTSISSSVVSTNTAGALVGGFVVFGSVDVNDTLISKNTAGYTIGGFAATGRMTVVDAVVRDNTAVTGDSGGVEFGGGGEVNNTQFTGNAAAGNGGALRTAPGSSHVSVTGSMFKNNTAGVDGSAAYFGGDAEVVNNVFAGNAAGEAGDVYFSSGLNGAHNTFAGTGTAVAIGAVVAPTPVGILTNTLMAGYSAAADADASGVIELRGLLWEGGTLVTSGTVTVTNKVAGSAGFKNAAAGDYRAAGAGLDAGIDSGVGTDIRGEARPRGAGYDMGAYEASIAVLTELEINPGSLAPAFVSTTMEYTAQMPYGTASATVTATASDVSATVAYASTAGACVPATGPAAGACAIAASGMTAITVTSTSTDGATKVYTVEVTVGPSNDASLLKFAFQSPTVMEGTFVSSTYRYTASAPTGTAVAFFAFTPTVTSTQDAQAVTTAGPCDVTFSAGSKSGDGGCEIDPDGVTVMTLTVTAEDGTTLDYVFVISTKAQPHASNLVIDIPGLTPAFVSTTLQYQTEVPSGTNQLVVTPTLSAGATAAYSSTAGACTVNGVDAGRGEPRPYAAAPESATCPLFPTQTTTVTIGITDGTTTRNYTILATRASAPAGMRKSWFPVVPTLQ